MRPATRLELVVCRVNQVLGLVLTLAAAVVLLIWGTGRWQAMSFSQDYVPIAPSTALLFAVVGIASFCRITWSHKRIVLAICFCAAGLAIVLGVLAMGRPVVELALPLERWLAGTDMMTVEGIPVGLMAPITGLCFAALGLALLLLIWPSGPVRLRSYTASGLAGVVFAISLAIVLCYAAGVPLLYSVNTIPMALLTAGLFILLSTSLLLTAIAGGRLLALKELHEMEAVTAQRERMGVALLMVFAVLGPGILGAGFSYLKWQQKEYDRRARS